jgi:hypothetical protein
LVKLGKSKSSSVKKCFTSSIIWRKFTFKMGCLRESNGHFFSRSQSVWKFFFLKKHILKPLQKNPQVDWTRLSNFGEVQKVRFLRIFSKARKKSIFFRMFIKTQRKVLITLNSLYLTIFKCFTGKYKLSY